MNRGVYLLFVELPAEETIRIGGLGKKRFEPGLYCYVGSGMNGLDQRVERHRSSDKKKYWHVDYFLEEGDIVSSVKFRTERDMECELNSLVSEMSEETPVPGFGSSDCDCVSHLHLISRLERV